MAGVVLEGIDDLIAAFEKMKTSADTATHSIVDKGKSLIQAAARANASVNPKVRTGALRGSITAFPTSGGGPVWHARIAPTVIYGRIQELGGLIEAHKHPWLVFDLGMMRGWRKVKEVRLPARPYLGPAVKESAGAIHDLSVAEWGKAVGG